MAHQDLCACGARVAKGVERCRACREEQGPIRRSDEDGYVRLADAADLIHTSGNVIRDLVASGRLTVIPDPMDGRAKLVSKVQLAVVGVDWSPRRCDNPACSAIYQPSRAGQRWHSRACQKAGERERQERLRRIAIDARLIPDPAHFDTLEHWILETRRALGIGLEALSLACGLGDTTMWDIVHHPEQALGPQTQQNISRALGVGIDELERLRPSVRCRWQRLESDDLTNEAIVELWIRDLPEKTERAYRKASERFLAGVSKPLRSATSDDLQRFSDSLSGDMSPSAQGHTTAIVKSLLTFAYQAGFTTHNVGRWVSVTRNHRECPPCREPGCNGRRHTTDPPAWLDRAVALVRAGRNSGQVATSLGVNHHSVRYWLPHAGVVPSGCHEEGCWRVVSAGSLYCRRHVKRHLPPPGPRIIRPLDLASRVPHTEDFDTLEDWLQACCAALNDISLFRLSKWCGIGGQHTLQRLVRDPSSPVSRITAQHLALALGASLNDLERLRPSEERLREAYARGGRSSYEAQLSIYGDAALRERARENMAKFRAAHTPEELRFFEQLGHKAARRKLRGVQRPATVKRKITAKKLAKGSLARKRLYAGLSEEVRVELVAMARSEASASEIARFINQRGGAGKLTRNKVQILLGDLGLRPYPIWYQPRRKVPNAYEVAYPAAAEALREQRTAVALAADDKCETAWLGLVESDGTAPEAVTPTMLKNKTWQLWPDGGVTFKTADRRLDRLKSGMTAPKDT